MVISVRVPEWSAFTSPVRTECGDDLTVWDTGVKIPDMEDSLNSYFEEITTYLKDNSLLISAPKSSVTLFTLDIHQDPPENTHRGLTATSGTMPKHCRSPPGHITIIQ